MNQIDLNKKAYLYKSNTDFEYYWYKDMHIIIQVPPMGIQLKPYAVVYSEGNVHTNKVFDGLQGLLTEVPIDLFENKLEEAFYIIRKKL